jgi:uncharacterized membrane protein
MSPHISGRRPRTARRWIGLVCFVLAVLAAGGQPSDAWAGPRSGGSFSGRGGFRSGGGSSRAPSRSSYRSYSSSPYSPSPSGGNHIIVVPGGGYGYGYSPFHYGGGYGGGGGFGFSGTILMLGVLGVGGLLLFRAARMAHMRRLEAGGPGRLLGGDDDDVEEEPSDRAYVYEVQLGLGRSARALQSRLEQFAAEGDTASETGLAQLLGQTALELLREKSSIRYGTVQAAGPLSLARAETKMNGLALAERSRFQVERVRGAEGKVRRSDVAATASPDVLEYLVVTVIVATRTPCPGLTRLGSTEELDAVLRELGGIAPDTLLGLEVVWTPADPEDALTEADLLVTYPDLRAI